MGNDISTIGNHNLNTKNVELLANDIVSRIDVNIEYGYFGEKEHFKLLGENRENELVIIGKIIKDKRFKTFRLIDENYLLKKLHNEFGDAIFLNPDYWYQYKGEIPYKKRVNVEKKTLKFAHYSMDYDSESGYEYLTINNKHYSNDMQYYSRWGQFCRFFTEKRYQDEKQLSSMNEFRKELMRYTFRFGGNKMYYLDDQSNVLDGVGQGGGWDLDWEELILFIEKKTNHLMLDVPGFLTNEKYRKQFLKLKKFPLSFVDDYRDLVE